MRTIHRLVKALRVLASMDRRWMRALSQGVAPSLEHQKVLHLMSPETVVDIGANRGQFALMARHAYPAARIESFEPLPGPATVCRKLFDGDSRMRVHEFAVGPDVSTVEMHVSAHDDSSSLLPIADLQNELFPGTAEASRQSIRVTPLDRVLAGNDIRGLALLKLDVQGFELQALAGCASLLDRFAWVYVECSFVELYRGQALANEVIAWLRERGFTLSGVYNMAYEPGGGAVQADFLFGREAMASGTS